MSCVGDETLAGWEIESIKGRWEGISTLKNLTIYATLIYRRADDFFEDCNLNNFRPMVSCRLPRLIYMFSSHHPCKALLEIVIRRLSLRAKDILLKDLMLAEEEQAKPTPNSVHRKAMEENKLRKLGRKVSKACLLMYAPAGSRTDRTTFRIGYRASYEWSRKRTTTPRAVQNQQVTKCTSRPRQLGLGLHAAGGGWHSTILL
jgi:hypothetical protein